MKKDLENPGFGWAKRIAFKEELPAWQSPYSFVRTGYRVNYTVCDCAKSIFALHNESLNIWTHLFGLIVWIYITSQIASRAPVAVIDSTSRRIIHGLFIACGLMPLASTLAHTFSSSGPKLSKLLWKFDFASVNLLLFSRALLEGWLLLACSSRIRMAWLVMASLIFIIGTIFALRRDSTTPIAFCALFMHFPVFYFFLFEWPALSDEKRSAATPGLRLTILGSGAGALGFLLRATSVPERWRCFPSGSITCNKMQPFFDIFGSSHQWWHVLTIVGPVFCVWGNEHLLTFRLTTTSYHHYCV